jgi:hypothetical protein
VYSLPRVTTTWSGSAATLRDDRLSEFHPDFA